MNLLHGDIGYIGSKDIVIYLSNSGNTSELVKVASHVKYRCKLSIGIFSNPNGILNRYCDQVIILPKVDECESFNKIPTTSIVLYTLIINTIVCTIKESTALTMSKYKLNHPGGNIGNLLNLKIKDVMLPIDKLCIISPSTSIKECLIMMCKARLRCAIIIEDTTQKINGFISDGDIRRYLRHSDIHDEVSNIINLTPLVANSNDPLQILMDKVKEDYRIISGIPIINDRDQLVGLVSQQELVNYGL
jgi:arabinose-5-phosphate isomerase